jgi:hypothetical protein
MTTVSKITPSACFFFISCKGIKILEVWALTFTLALPESTCSYSEIEQTATWTCLR